MTVPLTPTRRREKISGRTICHGFFFGESPRWHDGDLWFTDIHGQVVYRMSLDGPRQAELKLEDDLPSGLGWLPDGRLVVVAMDSQLLRRVETGGSLVTHADLSHYATGSLNDMVVSPEGVAYVGDTGFRMWSHEPDFKPGRLIAVAPDGHVIDILDDLSAPNGVVLSDRTLTIAQAGAAKLTRLRVRDDGGFGPVVSETSLAAIAPCAPDGVCVDEAGATWVADPVGLRVIRVLESGEVTQAFEFKEMPVACVLAGANRRQLIVCVSPNWHREAALEAPLGHLEMFEVAIGGTGTP